MTTTIIIIIIITISLLPLGTRTNRGTRELQDMWVKTIHSYINMKGWGEDVIQRHFKNLII